MCFFNCSYGERYIDGEWLVLWYAYFDVNGCFMNVIKTLHLINQETKGAFVCSKSTCLFICFVSSLVGNLVCISLSCWNIRSIIAVVKYATIVTIFAGIFYFGVFLICPFYEVIFHCLLSQLTFLCHGPLHTSSMDDITFLFVLFLILPSFR